MLETFTVNIPLECCTKQWAGRLLQAYVFHSHIVSGFSENSWFRRPEFFCGTVNSVKVSPAEESKVCKIKISKEEAILLAKTQLRLFFG